MSWINKKVGITGGYGLIGKELVELLNELGADVEIADLKCKIPVDLTSFKNCLDFCKDKEVIFHLAGIKGSAKMTKERPVDFMIPMLKFDTNMIDAASLKGVKKFLYTSSIAVLNPETDKYPAWAKKTGEILCEAMQNQHPEGTKYYIARPSNVYGKYDNFNNPDAMVITSLISRGCSGDKLLPVWGDGTQIRDFINARDVAKAMIKMIDEAPQEPINISSGQEYTIKQIAEIISKYTNKPIQYQPNKNVGDQKRVMKSNLDLINYTPEIDIETGIKEIIQWMKRNQ